MYSRIHLSFLSLFLFTSLAQAQSSPQLDVHLERRGKALTMTVTPSVGASECDYDVYSSNRRFRLSIDPTSGTLVSHLRGRTDQSIAIKALDLGRLKRRKKKPKLRENLFFVAIEDCGAGDNVSSVRKVRVRTGKRRRLPKFEAWLQDLSTSLLQGSVEFTEAFPALTFDSPTDIVSAPDDSARMFVVEQDGLIKVFSNASDVASVSTFLDLTGLTTASGERGLLSLAFHPDYADNGYLFVHYSAIADGATVVARYKVMDADPNVVDPASARIFFTTSQPYAIHNGGKIAFGPDGYLYIGLGDGGDGGDPLGNGQNLSTPLGAILRIDVDTPGDSTEYSIPSDNPFAGNSDGYREEIFAYGLRNPFRMSFDPITGDLWVGDVGQATREEVDIITSGGNYGWNTMEGTFCYDPATDCDKTGLELPVYDYSRSLGASVTGGYVYRGSALPELYGRYIFGDFSSGRIFALLKSGENVDVSELIDTPYFISTFGVDATGELYFTNYESGQLYKMVPRSADE